jgi:glucosamine--fructose-6-phosphate aminotransferase (isomerizing)
MAEIFGTECMQQKAFLGEVFSAYSVDPEIRAELERAKQDIRAGLPLVWLAMGASYCSSISGATRYSLAGRPSFPVEASEWLHYAATTWDDVGGPILITTSGESAELVALCGRREKFSRLLICNQPASSCWKAASIHLPILAGEEKGNATKSYINCAAVCMILASELLGQFWQAEAARVETAFAQAIEQAFTRRQEIESFCRGATSLELAGRGAGLGGALMGALTVREMTEWRAQGHSGGAFRHGPLMDVDSTHAAVILALGETRDLGRQLAEDCLAKGGKAVLVVDRDPVQQTKGLLTVKTEPVPEGWEGLTSVLVPQALTQALIERLGSRYVRLATTVQ